MEIGEATTLTNAIITTSSKGTLIVQTTREIRLMTETGIHLEKILCWIINSNNRLVSKDIIMAKGNSNLGEVISKLYKNIFGARLRADERR